MALRLVNRASLHSNPYPALHINSYTDRSPPRPSTEPVTAQRVASNTGVIMVAGQKIALGRIHARQIVTVHVATEHDHHRPGRG